MRTDGDLASLVQELVTRYPIPSNNNNISYERQLEGFRKVESAKISVITGHSGRAAITPDQYAALESQYKQTPYISSRDKLKLSQISGLPVDKIATWFQNRRARVKRQKRPGMTRPASSVTGQMPSAGAAASCSGLFHQCKIILDDYKMTDNFAEYIKNVGLGRPQHHKETTVRPTEAKVNAAVDHGKQH